MDLARDTGTVTHSWDGRQALFDPKGSRVPDEEAAHYYEAFWTIIADAFKYSHEQSSSIPANQSLLDFFKAKISETLGKDDGVDVKSPEAEALMLRLAESWGPIVGSPTDMQSLKFFWLEECLEGANLFVADTYKKILDRIQQPVLMKAEVKLQYNVTKVITKNTPNGTKVLVMLSDSAIHEFDEVVMTAPLGWLKINKQVFEPAIPARLSQAIINIGYGRLDKVCLPPTLVIPSVMLLGLYYLQIRILGTNE